MPTTLKPLYGSHTALTITSLNSLANGNYAGCAAVDNTSNLYDDALVSVVVASNATSGTSTTGYASVYAYGATDSTPHYSDSVTGSDATQTPTSPPNLKLLAIINVVVDNTVYRGGPFSVASAFGGRLPDHWGIVVFNGSGATLKSSGNSADYIGLQDQSV